MSANNIRTQFEEAYEELVSPLFRFVKARLSNRERALEITQEAFMKTWDYLREGNEITHMRAFIFMVARNLVINEYRKASVTSLDALIEDGHFEVVGDDANSVYDFADARKIREDLQRLDRADRHLLSMRFIESMSIGEIASALSESENVVSVRIHRALKKLKHLYT